MEGKLLQTTSHSETLSIGNVKSTDATCDIDRFFIETSDKVGKKKGYGTRAMAIVIGASVRFLELLMGAEGWRVCCGFVAWCWATFPNIRAWRVQAASSDGPGFYQSLGFKSQVRGEFLLTA